MTLSLLQQVHGRTVQELKRYCTAYEQTNRLQMPLHDDAIPATQTSYIAMCYVSHWA